jgi:hypothetical protein
MTQGGKSLAIPVHQTVELPGKRKDCWEVRSVESREHDRLTGCTARDWGSLAVVTLGNVGTREGVLRVNGWPRRSHHTVSTTHDLRHSGDILHEGIHEAFVPSLLQRCRCCV